MGTIPIAGIAVQNVAFPIDKNYAYAVPEHLRSELYVGSRVLVPFGRSSRLRQGVVITLEEADAAEQDGRPFKEVAAVLEPEPLFTPNMIQLGEYMRDHTFCTLFDALKTMVPAGINVRPQSVYRLAEGWNHGQILSEEEQRAVEYLGRRKGAVQRSVLLSALHLPADSPLPEQMEQRGILRHEIDAVRKVGDASVRMVRLKDSIASQEDLDALPQKLTQKQRQTAEQLLRLGTCSVKELCYYAGVTDAVVRALENKQVAEEYRKAAYRHPYAEEETPTESAPICLSEEQERAYQGLEKQRTDGGGTALLFGVTGSGKTNVYLKLIEDTLSDGKGVIVMVPEISLTPQTLKLFYRRFGANVAVFHSGLSAGERLDEWKRVRGGMAQIAVGTRSAVFAPVRNLGLIIMDEEQEETYQSDMAPRYHARDISRYRCAEQKALLVLASATPSFESYAAAKAGKYSLYTLTQRYGDAELPEVELVDMRRELADGNRSQISRTLFQDLQRTLREGRQAILLMNRRGYNTYAACDSCGAVMTCPNCSISLTYHRDSNRLMCHYCGYSIPFTRYCSTCGADGIRYTGRGTQHVEEELGQLLPGARILRMDADSTMQKYAYDEKLGAFRSGEYDIMVGTQMVAKGLDFENVTLVGVLSADSELFNDDYRSMERTFDLITQVVGRSGRGAVRGRAVIQTIEPENEVLRLAAAQDYPTFFRREIVIRRSMIYPPFCTLFSVRFKGPNEERVQESAGRFMEQLRKKTSAYGLKLIGLGPMPERIYKVSGNYRYRLLIKAKNDRKFRAMLAELLKEFGADRRNGRVSAAVETEGI